MPTVCDRLAAARAAWRAGTTSAASPANPPTLVQPGVKPDWHQFATAVAGILSVLLVAAGLYYTNAANREQQRLAEQGQITDRFTKAVEQLGSDKLDLRLGAIFALERIMRDSADDQPAVVEVLAAYVRTHAPRTTTTPRPSSPPAPTPSANERPVRPPTDVQTVLTVLGRRDARRDRKEGDGDLARLDLTDTNLAGANLVHAKLINTDLSGADLTYANLLFADLTDAILTDAKLADGEFNGTNLTRADLPDDLVGVDLSWANLSEAYLYWANLSDAHLDAANLSGAHLWGAHLTGARLNDANLAGAELGGVDLSFANLEGADLTGAGYTDREALRCARVDEKTQLPPGLTRPMADAPEKDPACLREKSVDPSPS